MKPGNTTPKGGRYEAFPASRFKDMDMDEFATYFHPATLRRQYACVATVLGLLKALDPLETYDGRAPVEILGELRTRLDDWFQTHPETLSPPPSPGVPAVAVHTTGPRPSFVVNMQFYQDGRLRRLTLESWGVRAVVYFQKHDRGNPEELYLKSGSRR